MAAEGFGECLERLMLANPAGHVCYPKCLARGIGHEDSGQVRDWLHGKYAPKLNSIRIAGITRHLKLTREQARELRAAQASTLALPRPPRDRSSAPAPFVSLRGAAVAEQLITLLESAPEGTGRDEVANTITITWRSRDALLMTPEQRDRWDAGLQTVLRNGWQIHYLVQLDKTGSRTVSLVQHMLDFIGIGAYMPRYFTTYADTESAASDLLIIPGSAAAWVYSARTPHRADAGILVRDPGQIDALVAHALQLEGATAPLLRVQSASASIVESVKAIREAEQHSAGRRLYKNGLSAFTQPPWWFEESSAPSSPKLPMTDDDWKRCLRDQRRRIDVFERSVKRHEYFDICPLSALDSMTRNGVYPRDDIFVAPTQPRWRRREHLRNAINVLTRNERYHIGFVDDYQAARIWRGYSQQLDSMWQVTGDGNVYIGTWGPTAAGQLAPVNLHISEQTVAQGFREYFDQIWRKIPPINRERASVIQRLQRALDSIEEDDAEEEA